MSTLQSLDKALNILEIISEQDSIGLTSLSKKAKINKPTSYRILQALKENGYIKQLHNKKYALTFKMFRLGNRVVQRFEFMNEIKRNILKLAQEVDQVVQFVIQDGFQILYVEKYIPSKSNKVMVENKIGRRAPMYCTSAGKAILAHLTEEEVEQIWKDSDIVKYTSRTIVNYDTLLKDLSRIKKNGYSTEYEEYQLGVYCIATPILNVNNGIIGAISISIPLNDTKGKNFYVEALKKYNEKISTMYDRGAK